MHSSVLIILFSCLFGAATSDAGERRLKRQSETDNTQTIQYALNNVTADTRINTRLLSLPATSGKTARYSVSDPRRFRVDDKGNVYTRVAGSQLVTSDGKVDFTVRAYDADGSELLASTVRLMAGNSQPQFSDDAYTANVYENAAEGSLVLAVVAQDPDTDVLTYSLRPPDEHVNTQEYEMFTINPQTGVIRLAQRHFQFIQENYIFTVVAQDTHGLEDTASVTVNVIDVNNNQPKFPDCEDYHAEVKENEELGTYVLTVTAQDADKGINAELIYALVTSPNAPESLFEIDEATGVLTTNKKFNRDDPDHEKELRVIVKANDKGTPSLEGTCAFIVKVLDVNDNSPMFDKKSYESIIAKDSKEDTRVDRVSATDEDVGENAAIEYSLEAVFPENALEYFKIDPHTGIISVIKELTELQIGSEVQLQAVAKDRGTPPRSSKASVYVTVKESSLPDPTFSVKPLPSYTLPENYRDSDTPIARLKAESNLADSPKIYYEIMHGSQEQTNKFRTFVVDESADGEALVRYGGSRQLDYEQTSAYNLTVVAKTDQQTSAEVTFQVLLKDKNDELPIFYDSDPSTVPENSPPSTFVVAVSAVDNDATSPNNQVTYSLDRESLEYQLFSIESGTGRISTRVELDREDGSRPSPFYTITVFAEDGAPSDISRDGNPNKVKQRITVEVGDVNDNPPSFDTGLDTVSIKENADIGAKVFDIKATDVDSDSNINYQLTEGNVGAAFDIDPVTGTVTVKNKIDYETLQEYTLIVTASDGKFEDTHKVIIKVENQNDVAPVFDRESYEKSLQEGYLPLSPILTVTATDPDPLGPPSIIYKLSGPGIYENHPEDNVFSIDDNGNVVVLKTLDRDEGTGGREVWDLSVQAWDDGGNGIFSSAPFRLTLTDINDNAPYLIQSIPVIMENKAPDDVVIPVEADDFDDHEMNGPPFTFSLDPNADVDIRRKFKVTTVSDGGDNRAEIRPLVKFDREQQKQYAIPVVVSDNPQASPASLTGTSLFTVVIGDENDNDMKPGSSVINVFNFEGKMPDTVIGRVYVDDPDDWDLPDKTFSWVDPDRRHFQLDPDSGDITMLQGTTNGTYSLTFQVYDKKFKSTVKADVTVVVRLLPREAVTQSGSLRIRHLSAEQFVTPPTVNELSTYEQMITELAGLFETVPENVDLFGVQNNENGGVDVRYAVHGSPYYPSQKLDGVVSENVKQLEKVLQIEIQQVNIDDCINETTCNGDSCSSSLTIFDDEVYKLQTNLTTVVGVRTAMEYTCGSCQAPAPSDNPCLNGGRLVSDPEPRCECPNGYAGTNCEGLTIHFSGGGYAWFSHLTACNSSHMSFDITTVIDKGLVIYNGPLSEPTSGVQDFFAVDVSEGRLRVFMNYGSGTAVVSPQTTVNDGHRHHVDLFWNTQDVTVLVDSCVGAPDCQASAPAPSGDTQHVLLNVDAPLQLGGSAVPLSTVRQAMTWLQVPVSDGFYGCLENVTFLGTAYDLSHPAYGEEYSNYCEENILPVPVIVANATFIGVVMGFLLLIILILVISTLMWRRKQKHYKSFREQLVEMGSTGMDEEGDQEKDNTSFDRSTLRVEDRQLGEAGGALAAVPQFSAGADVEQNKRSLDDSDALAPPDDVRNYAYEGGGSSAGSLSTINSGTTDADLEFDYLLEMGPRFRRLADIYGADAPASDSEDGQTLLHTPDSMTGESWC